MNQKTHKSAGISNLIVSMLIILMLISVIVGATYAVFSDTKTIKDNTIKSGNVAIETSLTAPETTSGLGGKGSALGKFGLSESKAISIQNMAAGDLGAYKLSIKNVGSLDAKCRIAISGLDSSATGEVEISIDNVKLDLNTAIATDWFADVLKVGATVEHSITVSLPANATQAVDLQFGITVYAVQTNATDYVLFANSVSDLERAPSGSTVVLMKDIASMSNINVKGINIDFNGKTITCSAFNLTDNEIKTLRIGMPGDAGSTAKGGFVGDVNIVANNASVSFYTNVEGKLTSATADNSMHFSGAFMDFESNKVTEGEITVTGGRLMLQINAEAKITIPSITVAMNETAVHDVTIVIPENITVPKITIPGGMDKNIAVENSGTVTALVNDNTSENVNVEIDGNKPSSITGAGAADLMYKADSAETLAALLADTNVSDIALGADIELENRLTLSRSLNIYGNGYTLSSKLNNSSNEGIIYISKNSGEITVNIDNLRLSGKSIPGISYDTTNKLILNITDSVIDTYRYGVHSRGSKDATVHITGCDISSWGAFYARGSKNETTTITDSVLTGTNIYNGLDNSFSTISIQYGSGGISSENVHVDVVNTAITSITKSNQDQLILSVVSQEGTDNKNDGTRVSFTNCSAKLGEQSIDLSKAEDRNKAFNLQDWGLKYNSEATLTNLAISVDGSKVDCYINDLTEAWDAWDLKHLLENKAPKIYIANDILDIAETFNITYSAEIIGYDGVKLTAKPDVNFFTIPADVSSASFTFDNIVFDKMKGGTKGIYQSLNNSSNFMLNVKNCTFNMLMENGKGDNGTGICLYGNEVSPGNQGIVLNVENTDILFDADNAFSGKNRRGISLFYTKGAVINIVDSHIQGTYALNIHNNTEVELNVKNSLIEGWAALNLASSSSKIRAEGSTFKGYNSIPGSGTSNDYATLIIDGGKLLGYEENEGYSNTLLFTDCEVYAIRMANCHDESFMSIQYGADANKLTFVNTKFFTEGDVGSHISSTGEGNVFLFDGKKGIEGWIMQEGEEPVIKTYDKESDSWITQA